MLADAISRWQGRLTLGLFACFILFTVGSYLSQRPTGAVAFLAGQGLLPTSRYEPMEADPMLCVLTRTNPREFRYLPAFLTALTHQDMKLKVLVFVTEEHTAHDRENLGMIVNLANAIVGRESVHILPITPEDAQLVYKLPFEVETDYGITYVDAALNYLVDAGDKAVAGCEYIMITHGHNLYSRHLAQQIVPEMRLGVEIIGFDYVDDHRLPISDDSEGVLDDGTMRPMKTAFRAARMDLSAIVFSLRLIRRHGLRLVTSAADAQREDGSVTKDLWNADSTFIEKSKDVSNGSIILRQILLLS